MEANVVLAQNVEGIAVLHVLANVATREFGCFRGRGFGKSVPRRMGWIWRSRILKLMDQHGGPVMLRYSLGTLFLVLLYLAIGFAALVNASGIWPQVAVTLAIAILILFSLGAAFWSQGWRAFGIGFSATGWLYFLLVFSELTTLRPYLLTESAINQLYMTMHGDKPGQYRVVTQTMLGPSGAMTVQSLVYTNPVLPGPTRAAPTGYIPPPVYTATAIPATAVQPLLSTAAGQPVVELQSFANIGHSLWAVIIGFVGGTTAQVLHKKARKQTPG